MGSRSLIQLERIGSLEQLTAFGQEWESVQRRCPDKHVMLDHRWFCAWLKHFGKDYQIHVLVLRVEGAVVGIVPLIISSGFEVFPSRNHQVYTADDYQYTWVPSYVRLVPIRRLSFPLSIPAGNRRGHFLFVEDDPALYEAAAQYMASIARDWDLLVVEGFRRGSTQEALMLDAVRRAGLRDDGRHFDRLTMFSELPDSIDAFIAAKSRHFRKRVRAEIRQAEERFEGLTLRRFRGTEIRAGMDRMFSLEQRSWKAKAPRERKFRVGPEARIEHFYREVAQAFAATDAAVVVTMEVGDLAVAGIYCLERDGVVMAITTFMDQAYADRLTTAAMFRHLVEGSIERGLKEIDFNGNTVTVAKWADETRVSSRFYFYSRQPYSRLLRTMSRAAHLAHEALGSIRKGSKPPGGAQL